MTDDPSTNSGEITNRPICPFVHPERGRCVLPPAHPGWCEAGGEPFRGYMDSPPLPVTPSPVPDSERTPPVTAPVHPGGERPPHVWLNGSCIAMLSDLPDGTWFNYDADDPTSVDEADEHWRTMSVHPEPVIVTSWADGSTPQAPTVDSVPDAVKLLADLANDGGTESIPSVDVCGFCWDSECDGIGCIANLDPDCADDHPKIERLHALLRAGHALRAAAGVDWNDERDAAATGCGYYPATPSPVQDSERPDTEELRSLASFMESDDDARLIRAAADWIESAGWMWIKPAADQGPDLSEAVALLDEYDQSVHNLTRFGTVEAQTDHLLASERVAAFARRLLDREGGT